MGEFRQFQHRLWLNSGCIGHYQDRNLRPLHTGELITYVVTLCNTESIALTGLTVTFNSTVWVQGVQYNYNKTTGLFFSVPGQILVLATTYAQNPDTGAYTVTPGTATLTVIDTI